jgi:putative nucleotidyltransferase with HDIG domain
MSDTPEVDSYGLPWRAVKEPEWQAVLAATAATARSDSEDALLEDVCEAAIDAGGYLLAWYGRVVHNGKFRLHSVSASGPAVDYLDDFKVSWTDEFAPGSPGGMAVATNQPVFTPDVLTDPAFASWRDEAVRFGIRSLVSFPVIAGGELDGVLTIYSSEPRAFDATATAILRTLGQQVGIGIEKLRATARINDALEGTIRVLSRALEARDPYTAGHQSGVSALAEQIALRMNLQENAVQGIRLAALVHDIGKIGIPTELLMKPGHLRPAELALIQEHVTIGEELLSAIESPWPLSTIVAQHHERVDGTGYPLGLIGTDILLAARIIAVADVTEAMARDRPYKDGLGREATIAYLRSEQGRLFDTEVVDACVAVLDNDLFTL